MPSSSFLLHTCIYLQHYLSGLALPFHMSTESVPFQLTQTQYVVFHWHSKMWDCDWLNFKDWVSLLSEMPNYKTLGSTDATCISQKEVLYTQYSGALRHVPALKEPWCSNSKTKGATCIKLQQMFVNSNIYDHTYKQGHVIYSGRVPFIFNLIRLNLQR